MRGKWILFAGVTILLAVAAGALSVYRQSFTRRPPAAQPPPEQPSTANLNEVSITGIVQPQRVTIVPVPIEGVIEQYAVEVGEDVVEGQFLAHIANIKLDSAVESANRELETAKERVVRLESAITAARLEASRARADASRVKSDFERLEKLYQRQLLLIREGATPRLTFEKAEKEFKEAKEDLELKDTLAKSAEERLEAMSRDLDTAKNRLTEREEALDNAKEDVSAGDVKSPADGIVLSRRGTTGDEVNRTMEDLFRIAVNTSQLEITIQPEPALLPRIRPGQAAAIHIAEVPGEPVPAVVREIQEGRVTVDFTSPTPAIRPGMSAQVLIKLQ